jgi:uncharacterized phage infection (PIP) family protein YhgE
LLAGLSQVPAAAQVIRREQPAPQTNFVDGLMRTLVDSQLNFDRRISDPPSAIAASPASADLRRVVDSFTSEAGRLTSGLQNETRFDPNIRSLLGDAVRLRATLDVMNQRLSSGGDAALLQRDYESLDQQWRTLSHFIKQLPSTSSAVQRTVANLDGINAELTKLLRIAPQMPRQDLVPLLAALTSDLDHLTEDIHLDLYAHPQRDTWINAVRDLRTRADQLRSLVANQYSYQDVIRYYKQFNDAWLSAKRELRSVDNRYVQRNLNRITQTTDRLNAVLWLPPVIDGRDILYLAELLQRNVETVSEQISLQQLLALENANEVFKRARDFYVYSQEFRNTVSRETNLENIRWDFKSLDTAWFDLKALLTPVQDPRTVQKMALVEGALSELRTGLGLQPTFDQAQLGELASELDNMADLLAYDVQRLVGPSNRYPPQVRDEALSASVNLQRTARKLHQVVRQNATLTRLQQLVQQMNREWQRLQTVLVQLTPEDRSRIARSFQEIAPAMAKLQVLYTL